MQPTALTVLPVPARARARAATDSHVDRVVDVRRGTRRVLSGDAQLPDPINAEVVTIAPALIEGRFWECEIFIA